KINMKLHEAIVKVLQTKNGSMTTQEIADELNRNKWYQKKDKSTITAYQIHGRTKSSGNYTHLFERNGTTVSLADKTFKTDIEIIREKTGKPLTKASESKNYSDELTEKILMNENNYKNADSIDKMIPDKPGLYCVRIKNINKLPAPFSSELEKRNHNIVYIGIATQSLNTRMLNQELRANGHGTFFRSLGAVLGFQPPQGSLTNKKNKRNYKFNSSDESKIIEWINDNLKINWVEYNREFELIESSLISKHKPILNIAKNPFSVSRLSELRKECVEIANKKASI
ncbi:MAG: hypothetical protein QQN41_12785, partial [Nitrosopumilus sp.]